jgi:hypothetical protein
VSSISEKPQIAAIICGTVLVLFGRPVGTVVLMIAVTSAVDGE